MDIQIFGAEHSTHREEAFNSIQNFLQHRGKTLGSATCEATALMYKPGETQYGVWQPDGSTMCCRVNYVYIPEGYTGHLFVAVRHLEAMENAINKMETELCATQEEKAFLLSRLEEKNQKESYLKGELSRAKRNEFLLKGKIERLEEMLEESEK